MTLPALAHPFATWTRAVRFAVSAADTGSALAGVLAEGVAAAGARAGAVVSGEPLACRECYGCEPDAVASLLRPDGPAARGLRDTTAMAPVSLTDGPADAGTARALVLVPLVVREARLGGLLLFFSADAPPDDAARAAAFGCAGLCALLLEQDRLHEEASVAMQARDHFLTALNHELRTPATAFALKADLLRYEAGKLPPRVEKLLEESAEHVDQIIGVLRGLLDLAHLGRHASPHGTEIVHPRELVADLMRHMEPLARRKQLPLSLFVPRDLPPLQTDVGRLSRILLHLLGNAIKYTSAGGIEVRLERTVQTLQHGRREPVLAVHVQDTGRGIPAAEVARVFEPFAQVEEGARTDSRRRGLGLGLPLARQMARTLRGDIRLESTVGRGTTATLLLPYHHG
ncbi:MAG TPA: HAMP domain-containing sensor histidine kinase [Longimicrobiaceae bacterium]|nr:HAMP domain-containing sensor histidine kinase [Longimicrobiaceae bacterium]